MVGDMFFIRYLVYGEKHPSSVVYALYVPGVYDLFLGFMPCCSSGAALVLLPSN
jgi:hypothetical protein